MTEETQGGRKAPRTHKREWADNTNTERQRTRRNGPLNELAKSKGWTGISEYLTAVLHGDVELPEKQSS